MSQETLRNRTVVGDFFDSRTRAQKDRDAGVPLEGQEPSENTPNPVATTSSMVSSTVDPPVAITSLSEIQAAEEAEAAKQTAFRLQREEAAAASDNDSFDGGSE